MAGLPRGLVLKFMNKKCSREHNARAVANARDVGILTFGLFISGFPGETPEMFAETRQFLRESPPTLVSIHPWAARTCRASCGTPSGSASGSPTVRCTRSQVSVTSLCSSSPQTRSHS